MRYFFNSRDIDTFEADDIGLELTDLEDVKREAAICLAELACDVLPGNESRPLAIEVRDERGQSVLIARMAFEVQVLIPG